eukprot:scaffold101726_cov21-Tisochrysis_lutea.AAC.3
MSVSLHWKLQQYAWATKDSGSASSRDSWYAKSIGLCTQTMQNNRSTGNTGRHNHRQCRDQGNEYAFPEPQYNQTYPSKPAHTFPEGQALEPETVRRSEAAALAAASCCAGGMVS